MDVINHADDKPKRFDQTIVRTLEAVATQLIAQHKEIRSVALVVDWDLPPAAVTALPVGVWQCQQDLDAFITTTGMQAQLSRMTYHLTTVLCNAVSQLHATLEQKSEHSEEVPNGDTRKPSPSG